MSRLGCGGRIASCEIDAVVANIARAMHAWASAEPRVAVHVGHADDWLASCTLGSIDALFLDHRGTIYHDDLLVAEAYFSCGARVIADNVLLPGAPLFLGCIEGRYDVTIHGVQEFMQPELDDWVVICKSLYGTLPAPRPATSALRQCSAEVVAISRRSQREPVDWYAFQEHPSPVLHAYLARSSFIMPRPMHGASVSSGRCDWSVRTACSGRRCRHVYSSCGICASSLAGSPVSF